MEKAVPEWGRLFLLRRREISGSGFRAEDMRQVDFNFFEGRDSDALVILGRFAGDGKDDLVGFVRQAVGDQRFLFGANNPVTGNAMLLQEQEIME
jgi:hypothetical protein